MGTTRWLTILAAGLLPLLATPSARARDAAITLDPPPPGAFVVDRAGLLDDQQRRRLDEIGRALLDEHRTPLIVVTIESMAAHWPYGDIRIETFAHLLFDQWEIGLVELAGESWNTGILLLVSKGDRRARIQLGAGWGRKKDAECARIMSGRIIPRFKRGRFGEGIMAGVEALDGMARGRPLPDRARSNPAAPRHVHGGAAPRRSGSGASPPRRSRPGSFLPWLGCLGVLMFVALLGALLVVISRSLWRSLRPASSFKSYAPPGSDPNQPAAGRGGGFWSGFLAGNLLSSHGSRSSRGFSSGGFSSGGFSSGGFSGGGSSGGGFSGGGGASGGW